MKNNEIKNEALIFVLSVFIIITAISFISANEYVADTLITVKDSVLSNNESISLKGTHYQSNYTNNGTLVSALSVLSNATINITIQNETRSTVSNYTIVCDSSGNFYSNTTFTPNGTNIYAPLQNGTYFIVSNYIDPNNTTWVSEVEISVINYSIDNLRISAQKANYNPSETMKIDLEAIRLISDKVLYVSNVSINGSIRNSSSGVISSFNCTTEANGKCTVSVTTPANYGSYVLEAQNFKSTGYFSVVPFYFNLYMKDDLGKSHKNVFAISEQARVEISITNASTNDIYTFKGYIVDFQGNVLQTINSTTLDSNNSFTNSFLFTLDSLTYGYKAYRANVNVTKTGDGSISSSTSFEVKDWVLSINKRSVSSGFEYDYSAFPNKTLFFDAYPTFRANGTVIQNINYTYFSINLKDEIGSVVSTTNLTWNATCGKEGCYQFSLNSSTTPGRYFIYVTLAHGGIIQTKTQSINVISGALTALPTDKEGVTKEMFGTNEFVHISLLAYNYTFLQFNVSDAEIFLIRYMNGTEMNYTQVANFTVVNSTNNINEWAWNTSSQRFKIDVPKIGGIYNAFIFANNRTLGANARFIVNPYDSCISAKDTPGSVTSGYYYVWQFKTTDTIYFEIKLSQANNPTGRATATNSSQNSSSTLGGLSSACTIDTATKQVVSNASISVSEVRNSLTGALQNINTTESTCQSSDSSGGYSCTLKPLKKWEGGVNSVSFLVKGQDGTLALIDGRFEARAFYMYGYSNTWQNGQNSNISLTLRLYEAGGNWWGGGGSGGLSGTVTLKKVEYMGRDGEWIWPPVDSGYNVSNISSTTITSGSGTITLLANATQIGSWKTGYYRVVMQATTSSGDSDYGYAWFGVKLWDVYGTPIECKTTGCNYKDYFNSKENITLFIKISQASDYNYNAAGGQSLGGGNVTVSVKKVQDCRTWPCKELNASDFTSTQISVNESSPWYWNANISKYGGYILSINNTKSRWNTGWYSVVLDINGSDTGYAWFNALAFYVETQPVDRNGTTYKYSIKGSQNMYFNVSSTKNYKWAYSYGSSSLRYNSSDYVNASIDGGTLRVWNQSSQKQIEYTYPNQFNASFVIVNNSTVYGNGLLNVSFLNGTNWPSGYYWGELTLKSTDNELSTGWLWFSIKPFRVQMSSSTSSIDNDQCVNATLNVYDPDWYSSTPLTGNNYTIVNANENVWSGSGSSVITYTNYTNTTINATTNVTFCPNDGAWGSGSWGGYHYLNVLVKDNVQNDTETGWLSFRTIPFQIKWGSISGGTNKATNANVTLPVNLTKSTGGAASGNLTSVYQWRYDSSNGYSGTKETYVFNVGSCWSNISGQCNATGFQNVTIYPTSGGWKVGYNYLQATWSKATDVNSKVDDWQGIYFEGRENYNGYYSNVDSNGYWKYYFNTTENVTVKLNVRDSSYNGVAANISNVQYAFSGQNCYNEWCRTYTSAIWGISGGGIEVGSSGSTITIKPPTGGWSKGDYYIKTSVSGSGGSASITGGYFKVKDFIAPNITAITAPTNNNTYTTTNLTWKITTSKNAQCYVDVSNYQNFKYHCSGWNTTTNNGTWTAQTLGACNTTLYPDYVAGNTTYYEYLSDQYRSTYNGSSSTWKSGSTGLSTGGTTHSYNFNTTSWPNNQYYGLYMYCYDNEYNSASSSVAFKLQR